MCFGELGGGGGDAGRGGEGRGGDGELLACGLVHHHSGAISCKIYHLT